MIVTVGKDFIVRRTFQELNLVPVEFNICKLAENLPHRLSSQDLIHYLNKLKERALALPQHKFIYIRRIDKITDIVADYQAENRFLTNILLREWAQQLEPSIRVIMTTITNYRIDTPYCWRMKIEVIKEDLEVVLQQEDISKEHIDEIMKISKKQSLGASSWLKP